MSHIGLSERLAIEAGIYRRDTIAEIAKKIGVQPKSVSREIRKNKTLLPAARYNGKACKFAEDCKKRFVCGNTRCMRECVLCDEVDCTTVCPGYASFECKQINKPPYVCNVCQLRRGCKSDRAYYAATQAHELATRRFSAARSKPQTQGDALKALDKLVSPLIRKGQPLTHICAEHRDKLPVSERTLYRYIESGFLTIGNLDLRRKVGYKSRKKKKKEPTEGAKNREYRKNRTYVDFLEYLEKHPNTDYVEMDTVIGTQGKGNRLLTMLFVKKGLMLIFLLRDGKSDTVVEVFDWLTTALGLETFRKLFPVILTDNGSEFKRTLEMECTVDGEPRTKIFYCDPQASWQKPHIEKNHEYIRYVIPKGKSLNPYTQEDITLLASHINSTKRMQYDGKSPIEMATSEEFRELLRVLGIEHIPADEVILKPQLLKKPVSEP